MNREPLQRGAKRPFRTEQSYAFERIARDSVAPLLRSRGVDIDEDLRKTVGRGESQLVRATLPNGTPALMRVRLCWRRDGRNPREDRYSAAQLAAHTRDGNWRATLEHLVQRDRDEGVTHTLFLQRDAETEVYAALVPTDAIPRIWQRQYEISDELIAQSKLGRVHKNHAANGDSPTIWLQDDRTPDAHAVADVLWSWPGVVDVLALPVINWLAGRAKYWRVLDALRSLGTPSTVAQVRSWLEGNAPAADYSDTRENLTMLAVNDANRRHYDPARQFFRSDRGHPKDAVFRSMEGRSVLYQEYDLAAHGVFDIVRNASGGFDVVEVATGELAKAYASAERDLEAEAAPIESLDDARARMMRAVVLRRGQREFRDALLRAYAGRCAITGCTVQDVLEAAHIVPYLGSHTQRADNGLLLRADIHTLFDLGQIWVDPDMKVRVVDGLRESEYARLEGKLLSLPARREDRPHVRHLEQHRKACGR